MDSEARKEVDDMVRDIVDKSQRVRFTSVDISKIVFLQSFKVSGFNGEVSLKDFLNWLRTKIK